MSRDLIESPSLYNLDDPLIHRGWKLANAGMRNVSRSYRWLQCLPDYSGDTYKDSDEVPTCLWCVAERSQR